MKTVLIKCGLRQETGCIYSPSLLSLFLPLSPTAVSPSLRSSFICLKFFQALAFLPLCFLPLGFLSVSASVFSLLVFLLFISHPYTWTAAVQSRYFAMSPDILVAITISLTLCPPVVLPPSEGALLPGAQSPVLCSRDRQRVGLPPLPQHCLQRPEAREHPAGLTGPHHSHRFRLVQREHRAQRHHVDLLRYARGKETSTQTPIRERPASGSVT